MVKSRFVCGWTHSLSPGLRFLNLEVNPTQPCLSFSSWSSLCWPPTQLSPRASCPCFGATENQGSVLGPFSLVGQPHPLTLLNNLVPYILKKNDTKGNNCTNLAAEFGKGRTEDAVPCATREGHCCNWRSCSSFLSSLPPLRFLPVSPQTHFVSIFKTH